jgi:hypothetical protein
MPHNEENNHREIGAVKIMQTKFEHAWCKKIVKRNMF